MGRSRRTPGDVRHDRSPQLALLALAAVSILGASAAPAAGADRFTCRASAIRVTGLAGVSLPEAEPAVANAASDPCADATTTIASSPPALATVLSTGTASATTTVDATSATAEAEVANPSVLALVLGGVSIDEVSASASYTCVAGQPVAESDSQVTGLSALGQPPVTTDQPQQLHFAGIADVTLNDTVTTATSVTRRAVTLDLLPLLFNGVEIVLGEASAGVVGNPCPPVPDPPPDPDPDPPSDPTPDPPPSDPAPVPQQPTAAAAATEPSGSPLAQAAALPPGCRSVHRQGWFVAAGNAALGTHQVVFHATTNDARGRIALTTRSGRGVLRQVAYLLDGRPLSRVARATLPYARLDRARAHTLQVRAVGRDGRTARIVRRFRYADYVTVACAGRRVVGRIGPRTVTVGDTSVRVKALVPREVRGAEKLRFVVAATRRHALRAARFSMDGRALRQHSRDVALKAGQLAAEGTQVLSVRLVPRRGRAVTVRIPFRTTQV